MENKNNILIVVITVISVAFFISIGLYAYFEFFMEEVPGEDREPEEEMCDRMPLTLCMHAMSRCHRRHSI